MSNQDAFSDPSDKAEIRNLRLRPNIRLEGLQFKSIQKLRLLCKQLDIMEKEFGIKQTRITMVDCFVCPDIDINKLQQSNKPTERLVARIILIIQKKRLIAKLK